MGFSKKSFADESMSDHKLLYHVVQAWENSPRKYQFCNEYNLSNSTMEVISGIKQQIITQLRNTGMLRDFKTTNENSGNWNVIRSALGMYLIYKIRIPVFSESQNPVFFGCPIFLILHF